MVPVHDCGWLRFHTALGRVDAHCRFHVACKLDRKVRKATLGLSAAWLSRGAAVPTREAHNALKIVLSLDTAFEERQAARDELRALGDNDRCIEACLDMEKAERGGETAEPQAVHIIASDDQVIAAIAESLGV